MPHLIPFLVPLAMAVANDGYFDTANSLFERCRQTDPFSKGVCSATISGAFDMMLALDWKCQMTGVTREQLRDVILQYIYQNPEHRNYPAVFSITMAT